MFASFFSLFSPFTFHISPLNRSLLHSISTSQKNFQLEAHSIYFASTNNQQLTTYKNHLQTTATMIFRLRFALQSIFLSFLLLPLISSSILPSNPNSNIVSSLSKRQEDSSSASSEEDNIDTLITNLSSSVKSLTSLTFDTTVTSSNPSAYLIEFFQPWCAHCQAFAPVWQDLCEVKVHLEDSSKFHLRRINCEENGDLCSREGVKSYPHIALYFDGKFVEKYKGSRSFENLNTYIRARTADYREIRASNLGMI